MKHWTRITAVVLILSPLLNAAATSSAGVLLVAGSPEYDQTTGNGLKGSTLYPAAATGVNNSGVAVGYARKYVDSTNVGYRSVRWSGSGTATELGDMGTNAAGYTDAYSRDINNVGMVVGYAKKYVLGTDMGQRAVRWDTSNTIPTELGGLGSTSDGYTTSSAYAVSQVGTVVGYATKYVDGTDKGSRAVRWEAGSTAATELGILSAESTGFSFAWAYAVNNGSTAVGIAYEYVDGMYVGNRAVRWDAGTTIATALGDLGTDSNGGTGAYAYAINEVGTAVGYAEKYIDGTNLNSFCCGSDSASVCDD